MIKENKITAWLFSRPVLKGSSGKASVDAKLWKLELAYEPALGIT